MADRPETVPAGAEPAATSSGRWRRLTNGRAWDVAAILVSWFGGLLLIGDAASIRGLSDDAVFLHFVAGCALSLALWWRRSRPMPVAIFLMVVSVVADGAGIAGLIALYTVVSLRRGRPVVVMTVLSLAGGMAYALIYPDPTLPLAVSSMVSFVLNIAVLAAVVALGVAARSRRELVESLRERAVRAETEAQLRAERLRARERERIAREMHDALAHRISMVSLHAGALQIRPDLTPEEVAKAAATIRDSAHHALEDLREILGVLRAGPGDALRPQPDVSHLDQLIADARAAGMDVTAAVRLDGPALSASLGRTAYRLVQEGLTNAGKHAPGSPVTLLLERTPAGELHIRVSNPLAPVSRPPADGRQGLRGGRGAEPSDVGSAGRVSPAFLSGRASGSDEVGSAGRVSPAFRGGRGSGSDDVGSGGGASPGGGAGTPVPGAGSGLLGLAERVELVDGRLRHGIHGDPRNGFTFDLEAWVPWPTPSGS
ncbi:sensor histidine kinase [Actinoplanes xinjiangensis]|uniref:sensor histidine kinase n=1 Tax=Actinoplanes xinjiangensis TaxID=512350 RepID=UPI003444C090